MSIDQKIKSVLLQAKRASTHLDVNLSTAKQFIARAVYQCHDFKELLTKIENKKLKTSVFGFTKVFPGASEEELRFLDAKLEVLVERLSKELRAPVTTFQILDVIWSIFGITRHNASNILAINVDVASYYKLNYSNSENNSVLLFEYLINDVPYHIYLTRVVTADSFDVFTPNEIKLLNEQVFSEFADFPIFWHSQTSWQSELEELLKGIRYFEPVCVDAISTLVEKVSDEDKRHQNRIEHCVAILKNNYVGTQLDSFSFEGGLYRVLGFPVSEEVCLMPKENISTVYVSEDCLVNGKHLFTISGEVLCLDLFELGVDDEYSGEKESLYTELSDAMNDFNGVIKRPIIIGKDKYLGLLRNTTEAERKRYISSSVCLTPEYAS